MKKTFVLWITGLSASGKTTLAVALKKILSGKVHHLDGDEVRAKSNKPLGFTREDRDENIRLAIDIAKDYQNNGYSVIASFISPYEHHRSWGRNSLKNFIEVFADSPIEICETRDPKGLYKRARAGDVPSFTGITDSYEAPQNPDIHLNTGIDSVEKCVKQVLKYLSDNGYL